MGCAQTQFRTHTAHTAAQPVNRRARRNDRFTRAEYPVAASCATALPGSDQAAPVSVTMRMP